MAMTSCAECNRAVSTEAAACPNCGAPPAKFRPTRSAGMDRQQLAMAGVALVAVCFMLYMSMRDPAPVQATAAVEPAAASEPAPAVAEAPRPPPHGYSIEQDGEYGYEQAISENDRKEGRAVKPMVMVRLLRRADDQWRFAQVNGSGMVMFTCKPPCEVVKATTIIGGQAMSQDTMRVTPDSIISAVVDDIANEQLQVYRPR